MVPASAEGHDADQDLFTTETTGLTRASTPGVTRLRDGDRLQLAISAVCNSRSRD
jgi:hypothetical protein